MKRRSRLSPDPRRLEPVKNGARLYGYIYQVPSGAKIYLAHHYRDEWFRNGEQCVSDAVRAKKATLAIDEKTLFNLRCRKIMFVGCREEESGDLYLARLEDFFDNVKTGVGNVRDYSKRRGTLQRHLPRHHMRYRRAAIKLPKR